MHTQCLRAEAIVEEAAKPKPSVGEVHDVPCGDQVVKKAPKTLSPGVWTKQIQASETYYNPPRVFPQQMVYGAEEVLAQMLSEKDASMMFTSLGLGEIVAARSYTATGQVNKSETKDKTKETLE